MTTDKTPTPPPGMRILSDEELTKPLPMDAMVWLDDGLRWTQSAYAGHELPSRFRYRLYATAEQTPTDWRKMCEELVNAFTERHTHVAGMGDGYFCKKCNQAPAHAIHFRVGENALTHAAAQAELLTRAKTALEESK